MPPQGDVNPINPKRTGILKCCLEAGKGKRGLKSLTVPTGGGKTIASLAFALQHAVQHGLSRVIYVIPYTSIIEQTAKVFRAIVGAENVLEYHANVSFDQQGACLLYTSDAADELLCVDLGGRRNIKKKKINKKKKKDRQTHRRRRKTKK